MTPYSALRRVGGLHPATAARRAIGNNGKVIRFRQLPELRALRIFTRAAKRGHYYHSI